MNKFILSLACYISLCLPSFANSDISKTLNQHAPEWTLSEEVDNISVYTRPRKDSEFDAFKAVAILNQPIKNIFSVISDPSSCPLWVDNCIESYTYLDYSPETSQFNNHFVKDAGLAFFSSGVLLIYSNLSDRWRFPLTLAGGLFVVVHGVFHIHMIFSGMISSEFGVVKEILVIVLPSLLTAFLIFIRRPKNFN